QLERDGGLDEERRARRRLVVDEAAHLRARLATHRNDVASVADRHGRVCNLEARRQRLDVLLELLDDAGACAADLTPQPRQLPRRRVAHRTAIVDRAADRLLEILALEQR